MCAGRWRLASRRSVLSKKDALTAFLRLFWDIIGPSTSLADNEGIIDGLQLGEMERSGPKSKDADMWILILEEVHRIH